MKLLALSMALLSVWALAAEADGVIVPYPPPHVPTGKRMYMEMSDHLVDIQVVDHLCRVEVHETFHNPYDFEMEGEYIFPLPRGAMPSSFTLVVDDRKVEGSVLEQGEARRIYEDIVRRMRDPALLEYYRDNLFRAKIYPIRAGEDKKITFRYEYELPRKGEFYEIHYPFKIEAVSPVPIDNVVIRFDIKDSTPLKQVFSPSHKIDLSRIAQGARGAYEETAVEPDRDFVLYYSVSREDFSLSLLTFKEETEHGFFLLGLSTPVSPRDREVLPKDIVYVLDISGSMSGTKIAQAREGLSFFVTNLNREDNFNIITFSTDINSFNPTLVPADDNNKEKALGFIDGIDASGGTNIDDALEKGLSLLEGDGRPSYLVFLTDGLPTVGVTSVEKIVGNVERSCKDQRIFTFGVGYDVNTVLLNGVAREGRGLSEYIEPHENLEIALSSFYRKIMHPALEDVNLIFDNAGVYTLHPSEMGDLFYGQDVMVAGRYREGTKAAVILEGKRKGNSLKVRKDFILPDRNVELDFIPLIWARKRVAFLLSEISLHGESKELRDEIVTLGKRYGIVTPYTSYLVREELEAAGGHMPLAAPMADFMGRTSGKNAVKMEKELKKLGRGIVTDEPNLESIKRIGTKTFILKKGTYVDTGYRDGMMVREVTFGSAEYFALLKTHPDHGRYLTAGERIIIVIDKIAYRITE
jgi:Ca-activated chloride channel family protein